MIDDDRDEVREVMEPVDDDDEPAPAPGYEVEWDVCCREPDCGCRGWAYRRAQRRERMEP